MTSKPRFLLTFLAWSSGLSGGDRHLLEVASRWREQIDVEVLAPLQAAGTIRSFLGDVRLHGLGSAGRRREKAGPALALEYGRRALLTGVRQLPVADVVVAASHFTPDAAAVAKIVRHGALGVGYVYHLVAGRASRRPRTLWSKSDERIGLAILRRYADVVFVSNGLTAKALAGRGFAPVHTAVGVDVGSFLRSRAESLPPRAVFIGRMAHTKGVIDTIEAWARVRAAVPEASLVMVGIGPERETGGALAERLGVSDSVEWRGFVSEEHKRRILSESRVLLAPSYEEGWGISVCEALASAVPVVAYRLPVLDELFDSAYLGAEPGDVAGLADLAVRVLTEDPLAETLSRAGPETASRYDLSRVAEQELDVILARRLEVARPE
jgi:glycosyltransferase involved in cell wall biosynthesis